MTNLCALCLQNGDLQESHIIPKFVFRWLKKGTPIRSNQNINRRIQDGIKFPLLCRNCEQVFSSWEKTFSEQIFIPLHDSKPVTRRIDYRKWMMKFAVSISWRVLIHYKIIEELKDFSEEKIKLINEALEIWRKFLLDEIEHPQKFEQHVLPIDIISTHNLKGVSPFINRYLLRSCHFDIFTSENTIIVYTKLCRIMIFGFVLEKDSSRWQGTKIRVNKGDISPRYYRVPGYLFHYLNDKSNEIHSLLNSMSEKQKELVNKYRKEEVENFENLEVFRAIEQDFLLFGDAAFSPIEKK
jgi:hypothetical protein